ncbi:transmembrane protein 154 isoform X3 [Cygnus olor]|uniref:transmembrane protein 154 isoform X3 n=1 Tax=Cygnus olor TaxID=8869 RepID=UPI001ADE48DB|nr:transmembrane protein 154 isoform X3 [Cygnus olor]
MQAPGWVPLLSTLLLAREGNGSENGEDGSGYGSPALPTATVIPSPAVTPASSTTVGSTQPVLVSTRPTEGSSGAESVPSTELHDMSNNESVETEEPSVLVYAVPAVLLALLILLVIAFIVVHKRKKSKQADCECLPTVREEEKESMANPSDGES